MKQTIITNSYEETQKLGADFAQKFNSIPVLALHGDLGSGKTTFIQGLAKGLGIEKKIISPTFIIMREYNVPVIARRDDEAISLNNGLPVGKAGIAALPFSLVKQADSLRPPVARNDIKKNFFYHVDLYRIKDEKDISELGLIELMQDPQNLFAIEWPEKIEKILPQKRIDIFFEYLDENRRKITFKKLDHNPFSF